MDVIFKRVGRGTTRYKADNNAFLKRLNEDLKEDFSKLAQKYTYAQMLRLRAKVEARANKELNRVIPYATKHLVGLVGPPKSDFNLTSANMTRQKTDYYQSTKFNYRFRVGEGSGDSVYWRALTQATLRKKKQNKGAFFLHRGSLRRFLETNASSLVARTGGIKVDLQLPANFNKKNVNAKYTAGSLVVRMVPKVYPGHLKGFTSGNWGTDFDPNMRFEKSILGIGGLNLKKLAGASHFRDKYGFAFQHRPLLQPLFSYWLLYRIPQSIGAAIVEGIK
jgi:hypothetical protein